MVQRSVRARLLTLVYFEYFSVSLFSVNSGEAVYFKISAFSRRCLTKKGKRQNPLFKPGN